MKLIVIPVILTILATGGCTSEEKRNTNSGKMNPISEKVLDSLKKSTGQIECDTFPKIAYRRVVIKSSNQLAELRRDYGNPKTNHRNWKALITLNRKEFRFFRVGDTIVVPDSVATDLRAYSVFQQCYPAASGLKKLLLVSNKYQAYACYEYGKLVRFVACNTGKERTPTFPGRYSFVWKERVRRSSLDSNWVMPFTWNFHIYAGNAFHQFVMPGRPVSHSCVRQFLEDAEWLFNWGEGAKRDSSGRLIHLSGTPVIFVDLFDFSRKYAGSWIDLSSNKDVIVPLPDDPMAVEEALIPICQIPEESRSSLRNYKRSLYAEDTLRARGMIRPGVKLIVTKNFNKLRRQKAVLEAKKRDGSKAKEKQSPGSTMQNPSPNDLENIKRNLRQLEPLPTVNRKTADSVKSRGKPSR